MKSALDKWQATVVVLAVVFSVTILAILRPVNTDTVLVGLIGIGNLVLGAGAVAHGVSQGSKATVDPPTPE